MAKLTPQEAQELLKIMDQEEAMSQEDARLMMQDITMAEKPYFKDVPVGTEELESYRRPEQQLPQARPPQQMTHILPNEILNNPSMQKFNQTMEQNPLYQGFAGGTQVFRGAGDTMSNLMDKGVQSLVNPMSQFLTGRSYQRPEPMKTGEGTAYNVGAFGAPAAIGMATLPVAGPEAILAAGTTGALFNPDDPVGGFLQGGMYGSLGETLGPYIGKAFSKTGEGLNASKKWIGEKLSRNDLQEAINKDIQQYAESSKKEAVEEYLNPFLKEHGETQLPQYEQTKIDNWYNEMESFLGPDFKKIYKHYKKNPTVQNAFNLQSQAGRDLRNTKDKGKITEYQRQAVSTMKEETLDSIRNTVNGTQPKGNWTEEFYPNASPENQVIDPNSISDQSNQLPSPGQFTALPGKQIGSPNTNYNAMGNPVSPGIPSSTMGEIPPMPNQRLPSELLDKFRYKYATTYGPIKNNEMLNAIRKGETYDITPKKFNAEMQRATQGTKPEIASSHMAAKHGQELKEKLARSNLYKGAASLIPGMTGAMTGYLTGGPIGGLTGGAAAAAAQFYSPKLDFLLDKEIARQIEEVMAPALKSGTKKVERKIKQGLVGAGATKDTQKEAR